MKSFVNNVLNYTAIVNLFFGGLLYCLLRSVSTNASANVDDGYGYCVGKIPITVVDCNWISVYNCCSVVIGFQCNNVFSVKFLLCDILWLPDTCTVVTILQKYSYILCKNFLQRWLIYMFIYNCYIWSLAD